jgi:RNA polymerase sigma factor (sigma-70 family)
VTGQDQAAFELLVWRHGAMVLSVCRGVLRDEHAAEDAFQATFLVLARKAKSIRRCESLAGWLYQVAYRVALRSQARAGRDTSRGTSSLERLADPRSSEPADTLSRHELGPLLDAELNRLPPAYRDPVVLCYFEGQTNTQAARQLGCPVGTISGRLARARALLRKRLTARGLTLPSGLFALRLGDGSALTRIGPALVSSTTQTALRFAAGKLLTGAAHNGAAALAEGVLSAMYPTKLQIAAAVVMLVGLLGAGAVYQLGSAAPSAQDSRQPATGQAAPGGGARTRFVKVASAMEGVVAVVGREVKKNDPVPADRAMTLRTRDGQKKYCRRLQEGDHVEAGEVLLVLDDRLARNELAVQKAKLVAAKADYEAAQKTAATAQARLDRQEALKRESPRFVSPEDYSAAELTRDRYKAEATGKKAGVDVAMLAVERAEIELERHTVRSPVRGVVTTIYRHPGEAVRALEPVAQIEIEPAK